MGKRSGDLLISNPFCSNVMLCNNTEWPSGCSIPLDSECGIQKIAKESYFFECLFFYIACRKDLTSLHKEDSKGAAEPVNKALSSRFHLNETAIVKPAQLCSLRCVCGKKVDFVDRRAISVLEWVRYGQVS